MAKALRFPGENDLTEVLRTSKTFPEAAKMLLIDHGDQGSREQNLNSDLNGPQGRHISPSDRSSRRGVGANRQADKHRKDEGGACGF
eukprot:CAMPEP_0205942180 /NCGR_PEP_ID=MMETSP1325-20131115/56823_1 /ASSEMBLY_ACC=CAM_ASM_000708 /TAXON_ID=236786 /ORGANISM="Florenciella sp., Strain RCC1007" /LENGTH=86 /DNA_ID=CAMNT_0053312867 /DNA_START=52 /DNA_END=311 /DNA_ORIENTATION=+